ncbi:Nephrocystin-3, partial [Stylophora pistillata]
LGPEHVTVATSYNNLGSVRKKLGDFEKAKEYYELALGIEEKTLGPEHVTVATSYNNLASVYKKVGDFDKAKEYLELALSIQEKKLGPEHVTVATSYNNLGYVHAELGDFDKAKEYYELALSIEEKELGPEHVTVATSYNNLASVLEELGDFDEAKEYFELTPSIEEKKLGPEHVTVATSYNNLGSVHKRLGDFEKAKEYLELALSIEEKKLGPEHVTLAIEDSCGLLSNLKKSNVRLFNKGLQDTSTTDTAAVTFGEWKDDPSNGRDSYNAESPRNQRRNKHLLSTMIKGKRADWDCTMLFYALLYSDCISGLNAEDLEDLIERRENELLHTGEQRRNLKDQQKRTQELQRNLEDNLKKTKETRKSLEDQSREKEKQLNSLEGLLKKSEDQRQVLSEQLLNDTSPFRIIPPKPSHDIASRDVEVADITNQLQELKGADESNLSILYISGNPGSGKSQLPALVAKRFYEKARKDSCSEVFCPEYATTNIHSSKNLKTEEKINSLISLISTKIGQYESWLLLADNVKSLSEMHVHLLRQGHGQWARGYLLIITQDTSCIPLPGLSIQHISVSEGMQSQEASSLLALISGISDNELGGAVAKELDYQPLALASAATYVKQLRQSKRFSEFGWTDFLRQVEEGQRGATETLFAETNLCYKKSMTTAITLAVREVMESDRIIDHALTFLSLCTSQPLNEDIVVNYIVNVVEGIKDKEMTIMKLQRCSLLLSHEDEFGVHICIHQVLHDVVTSLIQGQGVSGTCSEHVTVATSYSNLGSNHVKLADFEKAKEYCELALSIQEKKLGPDLVTVATSYNNLGSVHVKLGDLEKAKDYYELALSIQGKKLGPEHVRVATSYNNLGSVHEELGDFKKAKENHELALSIKEKTLGPDHVRMATSYSNLGSVHKELGDFEKAKEYHELAVSIKEKRLGPEHVRAATSYSNLGSVHEELDDLEKAKEYHELVLSINEKKLGREHVRAATSYSNLGSVHEEQGDLEKAKEYYELALSICQKKLGPDHVHVATIYCNVGSVYKKLGDFEKAKEYYELARIIRQKKTGMKKLLNFHSNLSGDQLVPLQYSFVLC